MLGHPLVSGLWFLFPTSSSSHYLLPSPWKIPALYPLPGDWLQNSLGSSTEDAGLWVLLQQPRFSSGGSDLLGP